MSELVLGPFLFLTSLLLLAFLLLFLFCDVQGMSAFVAWVLSVANIPDVASVSLLALFFRDAPLSVCYCCLGLSFANIPACCQPFWYCFCSVMFLVFLLLLALVPSIANIQAVASAPAIVIFRKVPDKSAVNGVSSVADTPAASSIPATVTFPWCSW